MASADILRVEMNHFPLFVLSIRVPFIDEDSLDDQVSDSSEICCFVFPEDLFLFFRGFGSHQPTKKKDKIFRRNWGVLILSVSYKSFQQTVWPVQELLD